MVDGVEYIRQDITDISSPDQLVRYATAGQLAQLRRRRPDLSQAKVAHGAGLGTKRENASSVLSAALANRLTVSQLARLDEIIGALAPDLERTGGLCSLDLRVAAEPRKAIKGSMFAHVPPNWSGEILREESPTELGVLIQASAVLSAFQAADKMDPPDRNVTEIRDRYGSELNLLFRRLILISVSPPTAKNIDAQIMLGILASYSFGPMNQLLDRWLRSLPLGFRVWRAITVLVKLVPPEGRHANAVKSWVRSLLLDAENLRKTNLYAGRSLDLELALTVPPEWSPPENDWVGSALFKRARNPEATLRERGMAAMGLWERAIREDRSDIRHTEADLRKLVTEFRKGDARPDAEAGLRWIALTLEDLIESRLPVSNEWPDIDEPWFRHVQEAANELETADIPEHLRTGTKNLFLHMILQNGGVHRRQAIETVVTSGWSEPIAEALGRLLRSETEESWLRIRALFALGFLQRTDDTVADELTNACAQAHAKISRAEGKPPRAHITEMHTSLFAVADCFGTPAAAEFASNIRDSLHSILVDLATADGTRALILRRAVRATAYFLIVTAQPRQGDVSDFSEDLLRQLSDHKDPVTQHLSEWALKFRFAEDGTIRPLLAAADHRL
jgi:hypothetical protein